MLNMSEKELSNAIEALGIGKHSIEDIEKQVLKSRADRKKPIRKRKKRANSFN